MPSRTARTNIGVSTFQKLQHQNLHAVVRFLNHQNHNAKSIDKILRRAIIVRMNPIMLNDPDTYIQWMRSDEPGENPRWDSQCGYVEQISSGSRSTFQGFVAPSGLALEPKNSLTAAKRDVERRFQQKNPLVWSYTDQVPMNIAF